MVLRRVGSVQFTAPKLPSESREKRKKEREREREREKEKGGISYIHTSTKAMCDLDDFWLLLYVQAIHSVVTLLEMTDAREEV